MSIGTILLIVLIFVLVFYRVNENFTDYYGMDYRDVHKYLRCCNNHGCSSGKCQNMLVSNMSDLKLSGYVSFGNKFYNLYSRFNQNTDRDEYFVKIDNKQGDYYHKKIDSNYLYDGDTVDIDGDIYEVHMYEDYNYYTGGSWLDKWSMPNYYTGTKKGPRNMFRRRLRKYGRIENAAGKFKLLYSEPIGRNQWEYYTRFGDTYIKIDTNNKEIYDGDVLNVNGVNYTFRDI